MRKQGEWRRRRVRRKAFLTRLSGAAGKEQHDTGNLYGKDNYIVIVLISGRSLLIAILVVGDAVDHLMES